MCSMIVFHWADVNSVAYRSGWQRLQLMAYNSAPVSFFGAGFWIGFLFRFGVRQDRAEACGNQRQGAGQNHRPFIFQVSSA